ncbi:MAG: hypothetical protein ACTSW7_00520 [Candidatus Thorarchaeota archaeon]|nr:hypothetical protein [Thermoplasmatales archaeon]
MSKIPRELLIEAINKMAFYLCSNCRRDGKFVYIVHKNTDEFVDTYNVLRHAGAIYALTDFANMSPTAMKDTLPVLARSVVWMRKKCSMKVEGYQGIVSNSKITGKNEKSQVKLGANALAIVALTGYNKLKPGAVNLSYLKKLADFMCWMQKEDGSFYSKFFINKGKADDWASLYYPGEAALAFITLHALIPDPNYIGSSINALKFLATKRQMLLSHEIEADHWALIATNKIIAHAFLTEYHRHLLYYHAKQIADSIIHGWKIILTQKRTTKIATRLEGLIAYLRFAEEFEEEFNIQTDEIFNTIEQGIAFLLNAYERRGTYVGGITRDFEPKEADSRSDEIRIDYVQHALSALLNFYHICNDKDYWNRV